ncbi:hypothetical protein SLE2022_136060 [Rubroshorea leprosula]
MANPHYQSAPVIVVAVLFPAQSHLNQMLQLSCLLSSCYNLPVHYVGSSIHIRQPKLRCSTPLLLTRIQFRDLPIPPFLLPSPSAVEILISLPISNHPSTPLSTFVNHSPPS